MAKKTNWTTAIIRVLQEERRALHYTEIAHLVAERGYYKILGATPASSINVTINTDIKTKKEHSIFVRVGKGEYTLRELISEGGVDEIEEDDGESQQQIKPKLIQSFGIYWSRSEVEWKKQSILKGIQQVGAKSVEFKDQIGIYLLHDARETIYVGQAIDQPISTRLYQHTLDRLSGRWNRFSWFGLYGVTENGSLDSTLNLTALTPKLLGDTLEAILIESIEPRQNRKRGNTFVGIEFIQDIDPEIEKRRNQQLLVELGKKL